VAKLTARGTHEVAHVTARRPGSEHTATLVLRSDAVVLSKPDGIGDSYTVLCRWSRDLLPAGGLNRALLRTAARHYGYEEV
jgi:hypothetical protein